jgi:hypothetical protein
VITKEPLIGWQYQVKNEKLRGKPNPTRGDKKRLSDVHDKSQQKQHNAVQKLANS